MFIARDRMRRLWVLAAFALLLAFAKSVHELWRDEAYAWLQAAAPLRDFFTSFTDVAHPALWYMPLLGLARAGFPVESMVVLHWVIGVAFAALLLFRTKLPLLICAFYLFSFPLFFAHGVLSRGYMLMWLLLWLSGITFEKRMEQKWRYAVLLALLAHTEIWAAPIALVLALEFAYRLTRTLRRQHLLIIATLLLSALLLALSLWPPEEVSAYRGQRFWRPHHFLIHLREAWWPYTLYHLPFSPWVLHYPQPYDWFCYAWAFALGALLLYITSVHVLPFAMLLSITGLFFYIVTIRYEGHFWHSALLVSFALFFYWFSTRLPHENRRFFNQAAKAFRVMFALSMLYGCAITFLALRFDTDHPYSGGKDMARYVKENGMQDHVFLLGDCKRMRSFIVYSGPQVKTWHVGMNRLAQYEPESMPSSRACAHEGKEAVLMHDFFETLGHERNRLLLSNKELSDPRLTLLHVSAGEYDEKLWLYAPPP